MIRLPLAFRMMQKINLLILSDLRDGWGACVAVMLNGALTVTRSRPPAPAEEVHLEEAGPVVRPKRHRA